MGKKITNPSQYNTGKFKPKIPNTSIIDLNYNLRKTRAFIFRCLMGKYIVLNEYEYYGKCLYTQKLERDAMSVECQLDDGRKEGIILARTQTIKPSTKDSTLFYIMNDDTGEILGYLRAFDDKDSAKLFVSMKQLGIDD